MHACMNAGFLLGFDETVYEVSESSGAVEICVQVFNPPNHLYFSTIILLYALAEAGSASEIINNNINRYPSYYRCNRSRGL